MVVIIVSSELVRERLIASKSCTLRIGFPILLVACLRTSGVDEYSSGTGLGFVDAGGVYSPYL